MNELLTHFETECCPGIEWPKRPATIGNLITLAVAQSFLRSSVPFGRTLKTQPAIWDEILILTDEGLQAIGLKPLGVPATVTEKPKPAKQPTLF